MEYKISATYKDFVASYHHADSFIKAARSRFPDAIFSSGNTYNNNVRYFVPSTGQTISVTEMRAS